MLAEQARTNIYQLCVDTGGHLKDLSGASPEGMDGERERERGGQARTNIYQLCEDTGGHLKDLPGAMA